MSSTLNEAWEWARSRRASTGGGRAVDRSEREESARSLQKALIGSPEPPLPRLCSGEASWRGKDWERN